MTTEGLNTLIKKTGDGALKRKGGYNHKQAPFYWWCEEVKEKRKPCRATNRMMTRAIRNDRQQQKKRKI